MVCERDGEGKEAHLVAGEDEGVGNDDVFPPRRREDDDFGNVVGCKRVTSAGGEPRVSCTDIPEGVPIRGLDLRVDGVGLGLVTVEADDGEFLYDQGE